ncbi:alpha-mannosidase 2-like [Dreissena polymorpha]|uniref:alpha-mannosidase 2-like n=1 Tax=Dreissena polymorpha TaxID=45954 RepID=UPI0022655F4B|nr:alpha-mannosidase 2-like [Dreissena polymorpha]
MYTRFLPFIICYPIILYSPIAQVDTYEWFSISDSCGPDRPICRKLDFREQPDLPDPDLPGVGRIQLDTLAQSIVKQFRLKNANYKYNVMMLPHGGDFQYDTEHEWVKQYRNLKIFMKYVNEHKEFNVQMRFGTLKDFFLEVDRHTEKYGLNYPVVSGDFYSYTENNEYWTGYFTTRQFDKRLGREVLESLRSAELFAAIAISGHVDGAVRQQILRDLMLARKNLGIFQHHDAITGTSKEYVVRDYELLLTAAFTSSQRVLATAVQLLLSGDSSKSKEAKLVPLLARPTENQPTRHVLLPMYQDGTQLLLVNSLTQSRRELVSLLVPVPNITIIDYDNNDVKFDIHQIESRAFRINFVVDFPPVGVVILKVKQSNKRPDKIENGVKVGVVEYSKRNNIISHDTDNRRMACENSLMNVTFSLVTGTPERLCYHGTQFCARMEIDWRWFQDSGGAYASITNGNNDPVTTHDMKDTNLFCNTLTSKILSIAECSISSGKVKARIRVPWWNEACSKASGFGKGRSTLDQLAR